MPDGKYFIDTNVFVHDIEHPGSAHQRVAQELVEDAVTTGNGYISYQVINECANVILKFTDRPDRFDLAQEYLERVLARLPRVEPSLPLYMNAIRLHERYQISFYDALIVAGAVAAGCTTLYSEDMQHGQLFDGVRVVNPFLA